MPDKRPTPPETIRFRRQRALAVGLVCLGFALAVSLSLLALRETVTFFYSPSDLKGEAAEFKVPERDFRLGGLVKTGSVETHTLREEGEKIPQWRFTITDRVHDVPVTYRGNVPDLFREGQGVVATGHLDEDGIFRAYKLLARHDENYMPPEVKKALDEAHEKGLKQAPASPAYNGGE